MQATYHYDDCPGFLREFLNYALSIRKPLPSHDKWLCGRFTYLFSLFYAIFAKKCPKIQNSKKFQLQSCSSRLCRQLQKPKYMNLCIILHGSAVNASNTRARKLCSVKAFFRYYVNKKNLLEANPALDIDSPRTKKKRCQSTCLSKNALNYYAGVNTEFTERDYCILTLFLNCGMRLSELVGINLTDFKEETIRIVR